MTARVGGPDRNARDGDAAPAPRARRDGGKVPMQVFYRVTDDRDSNLLSGFPTDLTDQLALEERGEMAERDELTVAVQRTARAHAHRRTGSLRLRRLFFDVNRLK